MLVGCVKDYFDLDKQKLITAGEIYDVKPERANVLFKAGVAMAATPTEVVTEAAPKKRSTKKKTEG